MSYLHDILGGRGRACPAGIWETQGPIKNEGPAERDGAGRDIRSW